MHVNVDHGIRYGLVGKNIYWTNHSSSDFTYLVSISYWEVRLDFKSLIITLPVKSLKTTNMIRNLLQFLRARFRVSKSSYNCWLKRSRASRTTKSFSLWLLLLLQKLCFFKELQSCLRFNCHLSGLPYSSSLRARSFLKMSNAWKLKLLFVIIDLSKS